MLSLWAHNTTQNQQCMDLRLLQHRNWGDRLKWVWPCETTQIAHWSSTLWRGWSTGGVTGVRHQRSRLFISDDWKLLSDCYLGQHFSFSLFIQETFEKNGFMVSTMLFHTYTYLSCNCIVSRLSWREGQSEECVKGYCHYNNNYIIQHTCRKQKVMFVWIGFQIDTI